MTKNSSLMLVLPLAAAIVGPLAYFKFVEPARAPAASAAVGTTATTEGEAAASGKTAAADTIDNPGGPAIPRSNVQVQDAAGVFRFEITPEWILARWPSVSTGLAQLQLEGYRVPLVTGTGPQDLAGALTYYFDSKQKLRRITFVGVSGDPRSLIGLLTNRFQMARRLTNDPGLVVYEAAQGENRPKSELRVSVAPLQPGQNYRRYQIELALERPEE